MKQETKKPLYKVLNEQRTKGDWIKDGYTVGNGIDPTDETICNFEVYIEYPSVFERNRKEAEANAQYTALAVNNLHILAEALEKAIEQEEKIFSQNKQSADWHNNNTPGVGQTVDYQSYPPLPEWVVEAKKALNRIS